MSARIACLLVMPDFKPGDPAPDGYLQWHEWAEVQHKAGLRQAQCARCCKWFYPQELSDKRHEWTGKDSRGKVVKRSDPICISCAKAAE